MNYQIKDTYKRWRTKNESDGLTWGININGNQFYEAFLKINCSIKEHDVVCELGPGNGRIFDTFSEKLSFKKWYMIDINPKRCEYLKQKYRENPKVIVLCQNIDYLKLPEKFDLGISALTLKHLYPDCSKTLFNISKYMKEKGTFVFDIIISNKDEILYRDDYIVNVYTEDSLKLFVETVGLMIDKKDIIYYPVGARILFCLKKKPSSNTNAEINELNLKVYSLQRHCLILEKNLVDLQKKVNNIGKVFFSRMFRLILSPLYFLKDRITKKSKTRN
ncbi:MAG: class I SAM-dependent methyltransferase [Promethearchaeota archaeon]